MRVAPASDSALCISFADSISLETHRRVISLFHAVERLRDRYLGIRNLHPAYSSLLIDFDPLQLTHEQLESLVAPLIVESVPSNLRRSGLIEIPVCYDREFAPDLASVAQHSSLTEEQVIATHAEGDYFVYFLGFSPGFAYLGGLTSQLHVPRLVAPRKQVSAGSVGIGGAQTGIYPNPSPGGWQLIGRTPLRMFDAATSPPSLLQPGDGVRFRRIDRFEFDRLAGQQQRDR
jgi:KipI family sensor histidine kinase inhibitor